MVVFGGIIGVVAIEVYDTGLPVWGYFLSMALAAIYVLPAAFIFAMTSQLVAINTIAQLIPGYLFPGKPIPSMVSSNIVVVGRGGADKVVAIQSRLDSNASRGNDFHSRYEVWTLHEDSTSSYLHCTNIGSMRIRLCANCSQGDLIPRRTRHVRA
jgi:hypothetical protein